MFGKTWLSLIIILVIAFDSVVPELVEFSVHEEERIW